MAVPDLAEAQADTLVVSGLHAFLSLSKPA